METLFGEPVPDCWLRQFVDLGSPMRACRGTLIKAHLIDRQTLRIHFGKEIGNRLAEDPRTWVPACGGDTGLGGHHGLLESRHGLRGDR